MDYRGLLATLHKELAPRTYVEIGCQKGLSLALSRCPSIAIDPDFEVSSPLHAPTRIFRETSDYFFANRDLKALLGGPLDLAFIDGMHQSDFALRDFINLERYAHEGSVIVIDDVLPQDMSWTTRQRNTRAWTGDIYKIIPLLRAARSDLQIEVFDVDRKGAAVVSNLDPANTVLIERYDEDERFLVSAASVLPSIDEIRTKLTPRPNDEFAAFVTGLKSVPRRQQDNEGSSMYLDLLKRSLLNEIYLDDELRLLYLRDCLESRDTFTYAVYHDIRTARSEAFESLAASREIGQFPERDIHRSGFSHTMMGRQRLDSLHECLDIVRKGGIVGDLVECGVWRGGGCIFMAGYLRAYNMPDRRILVADSFDGLPEWSFPEDEGLDLSKGRYPELAVTLGTVRDNFTVYDLLEEHVIFLKGWFKDTLHDAPTEHIALLRLDGDLYESTMDELVALYDKVVAGGVVIVDDYGGLVSCRGAVQDFFAARNEPAPIVTEIDWTGVYWIKAS